MNYPINVPKPSARSTQHSEHPSLGPTSSAILTPECAHDPLMTYVPAHEPGALET